MNFSLRSFGILFASLLFFLTSCHRKSSIRDAPAYHNPLVEPLTEAISKDTDNAELLYQRSQALLQVSSPELAKKDLIHALSKDTGNLKFMFALGQINITLKDAKAAIRILNQLLIKAPDSGPAELLLSQAYLLNKQSNKAVQQINAILQADSSYPGALYELAKVKLDQTDTVNAIITLRKALQLRKDDYSASLLLAKVLVEKHSPEAIRQFRITFNIDTTDVTPLVLMGKFYEQENDVQKAKSAYYECILKDPNSTESLLNMGTLLMKEDSLQKALRQFRAAVRTQPNSANAYYRLGICFEKLHLKDSAVNAFGQALVFAPNDLMIKKAWERNAPRKKM